jgi:phosphate transport system permease protein
MSLAASLPRPMRAGDVGALLGRRRHRRDQIARGLAMLATCVALGLLAWILCTLLFLGISGLSASVFTTVTKAPGSHGGLANAILGSLIQTALGTAMGTPIGLMVGTYLAEYAGRSVLGNAVRFVSDILLSAPSILIGAVALAIIVIPIVVRTTEDMLKLIPLSLREASIALGAPRWKTIVLICYPAAIDGLLTGVLLAVARVAGETAPLLFTSLGNSDFSGLGSAMASLPVTIYQYAASAFDDWVQLAWTGALLITIGVLTINVLARFVVRRR